MTKFNCEVIKITNSKDTAIILVSFGTADEKISERTIDALATEISAEFNFELRQAYTSNFIIKKLAGRGIKILTVDEQIKKLRAEGYREIILLPTHLTPGEEFDNKIKICAADDVKVLTPLFSLNCDTDFDKKIFDTVMNCFPHEGRELVLIGHGSPHRHNSVYENFQRLIDLSRADVHVGVIEESDTPNFNHVVERLKNRHAEKILIAPLLFNGGVHVTEDIAGDENSWKSRLAALGYDVAVCVDGLGSFKNFRQLYIEKLKGI